MQHKLIVRVSLFRFGVRRFERDVNALLDQGWTPVDIHVSQKLFKIICFARLQKPKVHLTTTVQASGCCQEQKA